MLKVDQYSSPPETLRASAPADSSITACCTASSRVIPPSTSSLALILTQTGNVSPASFRIRSSTLRAKRVLFSTLPPYWSVRRLVAGDRKLLTRQPCKACNSIPPPHPSL